MVENLLQVVPLPHEYKNLKHHYELSHKRSYPVQHQHQIVGVVDAKVYLKNSVDQNFDRVENSESDLPWPNVVASRPKPKHSDNNALHNEKRFFRSKKSIVKRDSHLDCKRIKLELLRKLREGRY